jgi:mannonate dehydratase
MNRRRFLRTCGAAALGATAGACAQPLSFEDGVFNPCLPGPLPATLREHALVRAAWDGVDPRAFRDCHAHVAGVGDGGTGVWISPQMRSLWHPWQSLQRKFYLNAACTEREGRVDDDYVQRFETYLESFPPGAKVMWLAFDYYHDDTGARRDDLSAFHVPNRYAAALARRAPARFEWICSVHPYRADALEALAQAVADGARAVKWLPSAMGMDPASSKCDRFYDALARLKLPLLTHGGTELAVHGGKVDELNNPLRLRRALERGVRVVIAHCASLGEAIDLDRGPNGPSLPAFTLFARLMDEPRWRGQLFGEISALTQLNRMDALGEVLAREDWQARLVNGSDYPLPGVLPIYSLRRFVEGGLLTEAEAPVLSELRRYNPLLFDFVLKRTLKKDGRRLAAAVFESRRIFDMRPSR